MTVVSTTGSSS